MELLRSAETQQRAQETILGRLVAALLVLWRRVDVRDGDSVAAWMSDAARLSRQSQSAAGNVTHAYLSTVLRTAGIEPPRTVVLPPNLRGPRQEEVWLRPVQQVRDLTDPDRARVLADEWNTDHDDERGPLDFLLDLEDAQQRVEDRIRTIAEDDVRLADRVATSDVLDAVPGVTGYRRVIHPELSAGGTCGMCIVAADRVYSTGSLMPIHARCKCTVAPIVGEDDPGKELNAADLKAMYDAAGGTDAASLKRTRYQIDIHGELGPVLTPRRRGGSYDYRSRDRLEASPAQIEARIRAVDKTVADMLIRQAAGEDLTRPLARFAERRAALAALLAA